MFLASLTNPRIQGGGSNVPLKLWYPTTSLHSVITQKTIGIFIAVKTSSQEPRTLLNLNAECTCTSQVGVVGMESTRLLLKVNVSSYPSLLQPIRDQLVQAAMLLT
jgi:hypothetical protein